MSTSSNGSSSAAKLSQRIISLDQFRGYTVLGMFLVNYFGSYVVCPKILRHSHDYNSYADTIMPHFLFAVGFAFRLTFGRRAELQGTAAAYGRVVRRMLGLALVSVVVYNVSSRMNWEQFTAVGLPAGASAPADENSLDAVLRIAKGVLAEPFKRTWFQTLMHIAATGLWLTPVIRAGTGVRVLWILGSAALHVWLSYAFNFEWVNGLTPDSRGNGIDGGPLGFLSWTIPAGVGTLACDAIASAQGRPKLGKMMAWAVLLMALGYVFSCGTRFYDVPPSQVEQLKHEKFAQVHPAGAAAGQDGASAEARPVYDPVWPSSQRVATKLEGADFKSFLAEPPFVPPPHSQEVETDADGNPVLHNNGTAKTVDRSTWYRKWNYWMMSQRAGSISYLTFSAGFSLAVYILFYIVCDIWGFQLPLFHTFGTNALAGYVLHDLVGGAVSPFFPKDSPAWYAVTGLALFFFITWLFVRTLEKQGAYLKV